MKKTETLTGLLLFSGRGAKSFRAAADPNLALSSAAGEAGSRQDRALYRTSLQQTPKLFQLYAKLRIWTSRADDSQRSWPPYVSMRMMPLAESAN